MIFDALSLAFIITIDELIYHTMLRAPMKNAHLEVKALMLYRRQLCLSVRMLEVVAILLLVCCAYVVAASYQEQELQPIHEALQCLCTGDGPKCHEALTYSK